MTCILTWAYKKGKFWLDSQRGGNRLCRGRIINIRLQICHLPGGKILLQGGKQMKGFQYCWVGLSSLLLICLTCWRSRSGSVKIIQVLNLGRSPWIRRVNLIFLRAHEWKDEITRCIVSVVGSKAFRQTQWEGQAEKGRMLFWKKVVIRDVSAGRGWWKWKTGVWCQQLVALSCCFTWRSTSNDTLRRAKTFDTTCKNKTLYTNFSFWNLIYLSNMLSIHVGRMWILCLYNNHHQISNQEKGLGLASQQESL